MRDHTGIRWVEANGVVLRCCIEGEGPPLVLVHQTGGAVESWNAVTPLLSRDFKVVRFDQRGAGMSEKCSEMKFEELLDDIAGLLDSLDITDAAHLVGPAFGSAIAWGFALRHPRRVRTLSLSSPPGRNGPPKSTLESWANRAKEVARGGMRVIESSLNPSFPNGVRGESFEAYRLRWLTNAPGAMAALNRMLATMDHQTWCADPPCPTLMMGCSDDPFLPAKGVRALVEAIPGASYVELQAGHYPHLQAPEAFALAVAEFATAH